MSSARTPPSYQVDSATSIELVEDSITQYHAHGSNPRPTFERMNSHSSEYSVSTTQTLFRNPEIRSPRSFSIPTHDADSIKSSSSLPVRPKTSFEEGEIGMALKPLSKTFHEPNRRVSIMSEQPARQGWEWVWALEGNWVKNQSSEQLPLLTEKLIPRRLRRSLPVRKTDSAYQWEPLDTSSSPCVEHSSTLPFFGSANARGKKLKKLPPLSYGARNDSATSLSGSKILRGLQYMSPTYPHFRSPTGEPEGLYCKTKRSIGGGLIGKSKDEISTYVLDSQEELPSRAAATLKGAASVLGRSTEDTAHPSKHIFSGGPSSSAASQRLGRKIGIAPWHRRNSQDSTWSVTSSIRRLLRGRTPVSTPNPPVQYGGHKGRKYAKVDITKEEEPTFLPSEATQVHTPPPTSARAASYYSLGFFLDLSLSGNDQDKDVSPGDRKLISAAKSGMALKAQITSREKREWWDDIETSIDSDAPVNKAQVEPMIRGQIEPPRFEWNTPEHLPNSPLCPLVHKERDGDIGNGNGICVYHGRK